MNRCGDAEAPPLSKAHSSTNSKLDRKFRLNVEIEGSPPAQARGKEGASKHMASKGQNRGGLIRPYYTYEGSTYSTYEKLHFLSSCKIPPGAYLPGDSLHRCSRTDSWARSKGQSRGNQGAIKGQARGKQGASKRWASKGGDTEVASKAAEV